MNTVPTESLSRSKSRDHRRRYLVGAVAIAAGVSASIYPSTAWAVTCGPTPIAVTSNTSLQSDYEVSSGSCFEITGAHSLDLNGHSITCTSSSCEHAVIARSTAAVKNGTISGPFEIAVEDAGEARQLKIDGADVAIGCRAGGGNAGCIKSKKIDQNVLLNCGGDCIDVSMNSNTSFIRDNFIDGADIGIRFYGAGTTGPKVEKNFIRNYVTHGIDHLNLNARIWDNIICERDQDVPISATSVADLDGNICDDSTTCPNPAAPFSLP